MITRAIKKCFDRARYKKWDRVYWLFDIHSTIIVPNYTKAEIPKEFYQYAEETMRTLCQRGDICMILYTCSHPEEIEKYIEFFREKGITFDYVNENPEVKTLEGDYGNYDSKFYFDVLFEDKAGFSGEEDWEEVLKIAREEPILKF
jgi:predicted hydrocarbon binding protein